MENEIQRNYLKQEELTGIVRTLAAMEERDRRYLEVFCQRSGARILRIDYTDENGRDELMYYLDDNLGGYTIGGIIGSLM